MNVLSPPVNAGERKWTKCNFAGGPCEFDNQPQCKSKSVLKFCHVLREKYRKEKEGAKK